MNLGETLAALESTTGALRARPGLAQTPELDQLWACGFPDVVWLTDEAPGKGPVDALLTWLKGGGVPGGGWPGEVAWLVIHAVDVADRERVKDVPTFLGEVAAALTEPSPEVCTRAVRRLLGDGTPYFDPPKALYALESLGGAAWLVDTALSYLESLEPEALSAWHVQRCSAVYALMPVLWRIAPDVRARTQTRLEALFERAREAWQHGPYARKPTPITGHLVCALDIVAHGAEAFDALSKPDARSPWHVAVTQDAALCAAFFAAYTGEKWSTIGSCAVFVAKDAVLDHYVGQWHRYTQPKHQRQLVLELGTLDDPRIVPWMLKMAEKSRVKGEVKAWFQAHVDFAGAAVQAEVSRGDGTAAKMAKAMKL